jgi:thiol:disulfide interchange protein DsbD
MTASIKTRLAGFLYVAVLSAVPWSPAPASPEAKPSITWSFTFPGKDASHSPKLDDVLASARSAHRPVLIDFFAEWCAACRLLDRNTYTAPEVIRLASRFVTIRIDVTHIDNATEVMARRFSVGGLPTVAFVSSRGAVLPSSNILGLVDASTLARELRKIP